MLDNESFEYDWYGGGIYEAIGDANRFASTGGGGGGGGGFGISLPSVNIGIGGGGVGGGGGVPSLSQTLTQIVDGYERRLQQNLADWQVQRVTADAAIATGWSLMNAMVSACRAYGAQGEKAAAERDRRIDPRQLRWDWILYYIDPITGGNTALPPVPGGGLNTSNGLAAGSSNTMLLILAGFLVLLLLKE